MKQNTTTSTRPWMEQKFLCELTFMCDITSHLDVLNLQLQGQEHIITDMYAAVRTFITKLWLWEN